MKRTIAAIATPIGEGGIAIIRISGEEALSIGKKVFSNPLKKLQSHKAYFGQILDGKDIIDEGLLLPMLRPGSYTGEDTVEIHCHGGSLITKQVLAACLKAGAYPAEPGEFTYRAFQNGKIDLAQAEGVQSLIGAKNDLAIQAARAQMEGKLSAKVSLLQKGLLDVAAIIEAWVDFPEEGLEFATTNEVIEKLFATQKELIELINTFEEGKKIQEGQKLALIGPPNAGKSSLMNALLGHDRAIVTPMPGTTRDLLESDWLFDQLHFHLIDTAGIRNTEEIIEQEGVRRSKKAMEEADLILLLLDASCALSEEDHYLIASILKKNTLLVWNKVDLPHKIDPIVGVQQLALSAKTGKGLDKLKQTLKDLTFKGGFPTKDQVILTSLRHKEALSAAAKDLEAAIEGLKTGISAEFVAADLRSSLLNLSTLLGLDVSEEILSAIFSKFCVGK